MIKVCSSIISTGLFISNRSFEQGLSVAALQTFVSTCPSCFVELWVLGVFRDKKHSAFVWTLAVPRTDTIIAVNGFFMLWDQHNKREQEPSFCTVDQEAHGLAFNMYSDVTELSPTFSNEDQHIYNQLCYSSKVRERWETIVVCGDTKSLYTSVKDRNA